MFGLFKKKIKAKDIIISNIGFHRVFNYCRDTFDHRLHDDYSLTTHKKIIKNLLEVAKNESNDDELYETILDGFELISPNGSPRAKFQEVAQEFAKSTNKLKGQKFKETRKVIIESKFSVKNIDETIRMEKENGTW
ncbi:hypothetical protein N9C25_00145 [Saprospiraceae bacterium]|nr:hypothetical protein [Saprospiraceae bacterium]